MSRLILLLVAWLWGANAFATVSLGGTRLIFDGRFAEASLELVNHKDHAVLIQAWLSAADNVQGGPQAADSQLPFVLTPHLSRLEGRAKQSLRLLYQGQGMPKNVESLLHLYVLEIPRKVAGTSQLSIAIRQRINVFYRPPGLTDDPALTPQRLHWTLANRSLQVSNPTPFHAALQDVQLGGVAVSEYRVLAPGASHAMEVPAVDGARRLSFQVLTDYGGLRSFCARPTGHTFITTEDRQKDC